MPGEVSVKSELPELLREARPLVLTNLGNMALGLVDVAVVGRLGEREIAAAGLGNTIFFNVALFGAGVLFALDPLIAQSVGARDRTGSGRTLVSGVALALVLSVLLAPLALLLGAVMPSLSVDADTAVLTRDFVWARLSSLVPFLLMLAVRGYLQANARPRSLMVGVVVANVVNLPVAVILVHGLPSLGVPALGVVGAGLASGVASAVQLAVTAWPVRTMIDADLGRRARWDDVERERMAKIFVLGVPLGLQIVLEAGSFWAVTMLVGLFGNTMLAAHHIALTAVSTTFQVALGIGGATAVRVGRAVGEGDRTAERSADALELGRKSARRAGLTGIGLGAGSMALGALIFASIPELLGRAMTSRPAVVAAAVPFFLVAACFQLSDGTQTVAQGALRGAGDTRWPLYLNFGGHYLIGLPIGWMLASYFGMGPVGLWWGLSAGLTAVALLLLLRFERLSRTAIIRV